MHLLLSNAVDKQPNLSIRPLLQQTRAMATWPGEVADDPLWPRLVR